MEAAPGAGKPQSAAGIEASVTPPSTPTPTSPASMRIVLERTPAVTVELLIAADARRVVLTRRELHRDDRLDLPTVTTMVVPIAAIPELVAALQAARARLAGGGGR